MQPNIIYILADDMGYGDPRCNNPASKIPTPNLDRLAAEGMRFTDAHAGSSVCTPSRYNILTGRYCWRSRLKTGIVWDWDAPLIEEGQLTVAQLLQNQGYHTACVGKWHLGWDWPLIDGGNANDELPYGQFERDARYAMGKKIDYAGRISGGPVDRGFDTYFGVDVPNFPPYTWFENARLIDAPTVEKPDDMYGHPGAAKPGWRLQDMIPEFARRAVELVESRAQENNPFFLYFPLTSPHSPIVPNTRFQGQSGCGSYGDFVCEVDWVVGQVIDALERTGQAHNTLLIFTSDNGPENRTKDDIGVYQRVRTYEHYSMGDLRGIKRDAWEGGHRVPFIARWPQVVPPDAICEQLIVLGDFMATCADITNTELPENQGEDSVSFSSLLRGCDQPVRDFAIHHSMRGRFAIRCGDWVFIDSETGGDNQEPDWFRSQRGYTAHDSPSELYNLNEDLGERVNLYAEQPAVAEQLSSLLIQAKDGHAPTDPLPSNDADLTE